MYAGSNYVQIENRLKKRGRSENYRRNLSSIGKSYARFCTYYNFLLFPADLEQLQDYAQFLSCSHESALSIANYVSSVRTVHHLAGLKAPDGDDYLTKLHMQGLKRQLAAPIKQATPLTPEILKAMAPFVDEKNTVQLAAWKAILCGFCMFFRASDLVPISIPKFDS